MNCHNGFTNSDYVAFDENGFTKRMRIKIPSLLRDKDGSICVPGYRDNFDQYALIDFIEFFAKNIADISERWNSEKHQNYHIIDCLNTCDIFN